MAKHARLIALLGALLAVAAMAPVAGVLASSTPAPIVAATVPAVACPLKANAEQTVVHVIDPTAIDVLANDCAGVATASRPLTITSVTQGAYGTVTHDGRTVVYNPTACQTGDSHGGDTFHYTMTDGIKTVTGVTYISFVRPAANPVSDVPSAGFISGSTIASTVPLKLSWCGVPALGSSVKSYRVEQSTNAAASFPTLITSSTTGTSSTRNAALNTSYAWRIKTTDSKSRTSPAYAQSLVSRVGSVQDSGGKIVYSSGWMTATSSLYSGGKEHYVARTGATATLTVTNVRQFAIVASRGSTRGSFYVYVDGVRVTASAISQRSSTSSQRLVLYVGGIPGNTAGTHTIQVRTTSTARVGLDTILTLTGRRTPTASLSTVPVNPTYGASYTVSASSPSGLPVTLSVKSTSWAVCALAGTTVTFQGTGPCTLNATIAADPSWDSLTTTQSFTVAPARLTVTGITASSRTYTGTVAATLATGSATPVGIVPGDDVTLVKTTAVGAFANPNASASPKTVTVSGLSLSGQDAGLYSLVQPTASATIAKAPLSVTALSHVITYGDPDPTFGLSYSGFVAGEGAGVLDTVPTCSTVTAARHVAASPYAITCANGSDGNYAFAYAPGSLTVNAKPIAVSFTSANKAYDGTTAATIASCLPLGLQTGDSVSCAFVAATATFDTAAVGNGKTVTGAGFTLAGPDAGSYAIATVNTTTANITRATQVIAFTSSGPAPATAAGATYPVTATGGGSGNPVTFTSGTPTVCTVSGSTVTFLIEGTCTIRANQAGDASYAAAAQVTQDVTVVKDAQTITFIAPTTKSYGNVPFSVSANASSGLAVGFSSQTASVCSVGGTTVTLLGVGSCTIRASQAGNGTYAAALNVDRTFTVDKATLSVTADDQAMTYQGAAPDSYTFTYGPFVGSDNALGIDTPPTCDVSPAPTDAGTYAITCSGGLDDRYLFSYVSANLTVNKATQTVTFDGPAPAGAVVGGSAAQTASASSGLVAVVTRHGTTTNGACSVSGSTVSFDAAGTCVLAADQPGDANRNAAPQVLRSFAISLVPQTITFNSPGNHPYGDTVGVTATTSSSLTVAVTSLTTDVCTLAGLNVTLVNTGTCTLEATQPGDTTYAAATPVSRSFTATPRPITVTAVTDTRTADGTTASSGTPMITAGDLAAGDTSAFIQTFDTIAAGPDKTITPAGDVLHGATNATARYSITWQSVSTGTILPGPATMLTLTVYAQPTAGDPFSLSVTARDQYGNGDSNYVGTIHFSSTDGSATLPPDFEFGPFEVGTKMFTGVILETAGPQAITVGDGTLTVTTNDITVSPASASLATSTITGSPSSLPGDGIATSTISVQLRDPYGNALGTSGGTVTLACTGPGSLGAVTDNGNGTYTATYTSAVVGAPDSAVITGELDSQPLDDHAQIDLTP